jgi:hypothetical protein
VEDADWDDDATAREIQKESKLYQKMNAEVQTFLQGSSSGCQEGDGHHSPSDVEVAIYRGFIGTAEIKLVYMDQSCLFNLMDAELSELSLDNSEFPNMSCFSACYHVSSFDFGQPPFVGSLMLWKSSSDDMAGGVSLGPPSVQQNPALLSPPLGMSTSVSAQSISDMLINESKAQQPESRPDVIDLAAFPSASKGPPQTSPQVATRTIQLSPSVDRLADHLSHPQSKQNPFEDRTRAFVPPPSEPRVKTPPGGRVIGGCVESEFGNVEGGGYVQTYCVMQSSDAAAPQEKDIYVRLGENVYSGTMTFPATFGISDFVDEIPSMRQQQDRLQHLTSTSKLRVDCAFTKPMQTMIEKSKEILRMIALADSTLEMLVSFGSKLCGAADGGGAGTNHTQALPWLDDARASFFEFCTNGQDAQMLDVDMMAFKVYLTDLILVTTHYHHRHYRHHRRHHRHHQPSSPPTIVTIHHRRHHQPSSPSTIITANTATITVTTNHRHHHYRHHRRHHHPPSSTPLPPPSPSSPSIVTITITDRHHHRDHHHRHHHAPSFLPSFLPPSLSPFLPFSLSPFLPFSLSPFLPFSFSPFLPFSLPSFLPSVLPSNHTYLHPYLIK